MSLKNWLKGAGIGAAGLLTLPLEADAQQKPDLPEPVYQELHDEEGKNLSLLHQRDIDDDGQNDIYVISTMTSTRWDVSDNLTGKIEKYKKSDRHTAMKGTPTVVFYRTTDGDLERHLYDNEENTTPVDRGPAGFWVDNTGENLSYMADKHNLMTQDEKGESIEIYTWDEVDNGFKHKILWDKNGYGGIESSPTFSFYQENEEGDLYENENWQPLGDFDDGELYKPDEVTPQ